jgi:hypothetical protein
MADTPMDDSQTRNGLAELPESIRSIRVGRLEEMAVRDVWPMEERHLTPWLAINLDILETELGIRLELVKREHRVGRYELDLLLRSVDDGRVVIVENQLGSSDHNHLGQLLAYAAGTEADLVVWLAEVFTDEHLAALEWMNTAMGEDAGFFALTLKAVRIGASDPAPILETKVRPNEWLKKTGRQRQVAQRDFQDWSWEKYETELRVPHERIEVGIRLAERIDQALSHRGLELNQQFRKGYLAFQRTGGYNVILIDVYWNRAPRIGVRLPASPEELDLKSPYSEFDAWYDAGQKEWGLGPISLATIPDINPLLDLILPFHPSSGPMTMPHGPTDGFAS